MVETDPLFGAFQRSKNARVRQHASWSVSVQQTMCKEILAALEFDASTAKRAQYEAFDFELTAPGLVTVRNESHENADEHSYRVNVEDGIPVVCECPSDTYHEGACKHRVAVAIREPVLEAATDHEGDEKQEVATDGGTAVERSEVGQQVEDRPSDCDCIPTFKDLPCWPCYRDGFRTPNPHAETETKD